MPKLRSYENRGRPRFSMPTRSGPGIGELLKQYDARGNNQHTGDAPGILGQRKGNEPINLVGTSPLS